jgi:hypothetical protein
MKERAEMKKAGYFVTDCAEEFADVETLKGDARSHYSHVNIVEPGEIERARTRAAQIAEENPGTTVIVYEVLFKPVVVFKSEVVVTQSNIGLDDPEPSSRPLVRDADGNLQAGTSNSVFARR